MTAKSSQIVESCCAVSSFCSLQVSVFPWVGGVEKHRFGSLGCSLQTLIQVVRSGFWRLLRASEGLCCWQLVALPDEAAACHLPVEVCHSTLSLQQPDVQLLGGHHVLLLAVAGAGRGLSRQGLCSLLGRGTAPCRAGGCSCCSVLQGLPVIAVGGGSTGGLRPCLAADSAAVVSGGGGECIELSVEMLLRACWEAGRLGESSRGGHCQ